MQEPRLTDVSKRGLAMKRTMFGGKCPRSVKDSTGTKSLKILLLTVICVLTLIISPVVYGQAAGSFSGNVLDKSGSGYRAKDKLRRKPEDQDFLCVSAVMLFHRRDAENTEIS